MHLATGEYYAIKVLSKQLIFQKDRIMKVFNEKSIMSSIRFEFLAQLDYFFQDHNFLYFATPYCPGGDLYTQLRKYKQFPEMVAKFYIAQITLALEYLHSLSLIHRDVKPENVVIGFDGYIKLTDFGFSKRVVGRTYSFCGTAEYIAPEILKGEGYGFAVDWWAMGIMLYELIFGRSPFENKNRLKIFSLIQSGDYRFPQGQWSSSDVRDLIDELLQNNYTKRLGNLKGGAKDIKNHPFFHDLDWKELLKKRIRPPFKPKMKSIRDSSHFSKVPFDQLVKAQDNFKDYFSILD
ncbi:cAMP-dependent protein kinase catalytic subunit alpha-like [Cimex lectularius]|uniref:Uncharacterized protein n=1 Tax=Cimex lectularius TaxID=79782 RepID=A0A8I6RSS8_CIMLE|nr:cAMP-dependent protein kinase catalytic subunit alpha-like [Cimex lectularius]